MLNPSSHPISRSILLTVFSNIAQEIWDGGLAALRLAASTIHTGSVLPTADLDELSQEKLSAMPSSSKNPAHHSFNGNRVMLLTFLMSATSLGILAVFDRLGETERNELGDRRRKGTRFTIREIWWIFFGTNCFLCARSFAGRGRTDQALSGIGKPAGQPQVWEVWLDGVALQRALVCVCVRVRHTLSAVSGFALL